MFWKGKSKKENHQHKNKLKHPDEKKIFPDFQYERFDTIVKT